MNKTTQPPISNEEAMFIQHGVFFRKKSDHHWHVEGRTGWIDYWPTTHKWCAHGTNDIRFGLLQLIQYARPELTQVSILRRGLAQLVGAETPEDLAALHSALLVQRDVPDEDRQAMLEGIRILLNNPEPAFRAEQEDVRMELELLRHHVATEALYCQRWAKDSMLKNDLERMERHLNRRDSLLKALPDSYRTLVYRDDSNPQAEVQP